MRLVLLVSILVALARPQEPTRQTEDAPVAPASDAPQVDPQVDPAEPSEGLAEPSDTALALDERVRRMTADVLEETADRQQADELYDAVVFELTTQGQRFIDALATAESVHDRIAPAANAEAPAGGAGKEQTGETGESGSTDGQAPAAGEALADLHAALWRVYEARIALLPAMTSERRARVVGAGVEGMRELRRELRFVYYHLRYQRLAVPDGLRDVWTGILVAPVPAARSVVVIFAAVFLFRTWRRWAKEGLARLHQRLLGGFGPPTVARMRLARLLWYVDRVRRPLEWMVLFSTVFGALRLEQIPEPVWVVRTVVHWILLAWFLVALVAGVASRSVWSDSKSRARLRLRSLRLIASWFVFLGLGTQLAEHFALKGTLYSWVRISFQVLAVPVVLALILMWRREVLRRLRAEASLGDAAFAEGLLERRSRLGSLVSVVVGAVYLGAVTLQRVLFIGLSRFAGGRRLLAEARRREVSRQRAEGTRRGVRPLPEARWVRLVRGPTELIEGVFEAELERVHDLLGHGAGVVVVVAERGGGLTRFLQRVAESFEEESFLFQCPFGGYDEMLRVLAGELGLAGEVSEERLLERAAETGPRVGVVDDLHRLTRPILGGQADLDRLAELTRRFGFRWVVGLGSAAYQYLRRVRETRILGPVLELPPWTEEQLGELVERSSEEAGIVPDYSRLVMRRRPDDVRFEDPVERNRHGFLRVLWIASAGNPDVALRLWADSLGVDERGVMFVRQLLEPATGELEALPLDGLLTLRFLLMAERALPERVAQALQVSPDQVASILSVLSQRGWVDEVEGRFGVDPKWFRTVTRVLSRKNLLAMGAPQQDAQRSFLRRQLEGSTA